MQAVLSKGFIESYAKVPVKFGFGELGKFVYERTYSRIIGEEKRKEQWHETVARVVNGCYRMQRDHIENVNDAPWNDQQAERSAQEMFLRMFQMKFLPGGRGLCNMGSVVTENKKLYLALHNCSFISTFDMNVNPSKPFRRIIDKSMLGSGVGSDVRGSGTVVVQSPTEQKEPFIIEDSREGWAGAVGDLIDRYFHFTQPKTPTTTASVSLNSTTASSTTTAATTLMPSSTSSATSSVAKATTSKITVLKTSSGYLQYDCSKIRDAGKPIATFDGIAPGPKPLQDLLIGVCEDLEANVGKPITITTIANIINRIGLCVVSGNIRRSALALTCEPKSKEEFDEFINLKNYKKNPGRVEFGHTSNNSLVANAETDFSKIIPLIEQNGEPGLIFLENARTYGRMCQLCSGDSGVMGSNPCFEQFLWNGESCNLVECMLNRLEGNTFEEQLADFKRTLKFAYLYAKTVTLGKTHDKDSNAVMLRNRKIGVSLTGVAQFLAKFSLSQLKRLCNEGYEELKKWDIIYSDWFSVPRSVKITTIKPSGTVSLLAGSTPGIHVPEANYYIRRVTVASTYKTDLKKIPKDEYSSVIEFPIHVESNMVKNNTSMTKQLELAAFMQQEWSDNGVSCTVSFDQKTESEILADVLPFYAKRLKAVSFLPKIDLKSKYKFLPNEEITKEQYEKMMAEEEVETKRQASSTSTTPVPLQDIEDEGGCTTDVCQLKDMIKKLNA